MNKKTKSLKKMKVMTIVGTRPEVIKLSRVITELQCHVQHILVHTGQNHDYELNQIFFKQLKLSKPDYFLDIVGNIKSRPTLTANYQVKNASIARFF